MELMQRSDDVWCTMSRQGRDTVHVGVGAKARLLWDRPTHCGRRQLKVTQTRLCPRRGGDFLSGDLKEVSSCRVPSSYLSMLPGAGRRTTWPRAQAELFLYSVS